MVNINKNKFKFLLGLSLMFSMLYAQKPIIWNMESIKQAKNNYSEAVKVLLRDADRELNKTIITVMDKPLTPQSGDKHDYMSMGRYWWPNPNTADGLPYIRKDGVSNPEIEKLDRIPLSQMTRGIKLLSLAFAITGDEKYLYKAADNLEIWFLDKKTRMNPNLNYGQTIPGHNNGLGRGEGLIDTYNFVEMLDGVELLLASKKFPKKIETGLKEWFSKFLEWMLTSPIGIEEYEANNNHGTAFDVQVARFALFADKTDIARKHVTYFAKLRIFTQIEPNGAQPLELARTTAFGYSVFNLTHMLDMCNIANSIGLDVINAVSPDGRSIQKAVEFLLPFAGKNVEDFPYQQIHDWDKVQQDFALQLYRLDKIKNMANFQPYYKQYTLSNVKNINLIIF